jgi:hypothetical protein
MQQGIPPNSFSAPLQSQTTAAQTPPHTPNHAALPGVGSARTWHDAGLPDRGSRGNSGIDRSVRPRAAAIDVQACIYNDDPALAATILDGCLGLEPQQSINPSQVRQTQPNPSELNSLQAFFPPEMEENNTYFQHALHVMSERTRFEISPMAPPTPWPTPHHTAPTEQRRAAAAWSPPPAQAFESSCEIQPAPAAVNRQHRVAAPTAPVLEPLDLSGLDDVSQDPLPSGLRTKELQENVMEMFKASWVRQNKKISERTIARINKHIGYTLKNTKEYANKYNGADAKKPERTITMVFYSLYKKAKESSPNICRKIETIEEAQRVVDEMILKAADSTEEISFITHRFLKNKGTEYKLLSIKCFHFLVIDFVCSLFDLNDTQRLELQESINVLTNDTYANKMYGDAKEIHSNEDIRLLAFVNGHEEKVISSFYKNVFKSVMNEYPAVKANSAEHRHIPEQSLTALLARGMATGWDTVKQTLEKMFSNRRGLKACLWHIESYSPTCQWLKDLHEELCAAQSTTD